MRPYFFCALVITACGNSSGPGPTPAFVGTDPAGDTAPPWNTSASTVGVCTPGGFIEALPSTNNGSGNVPNFAYPPTWFSCPGSACESVGSYLVQCSGSPTDDDASSDDGEAAVGAEASVDAAASVDASVEAEASVDAAATTDADALGDARAD